MCIIIIQCNECVIRFLFFYLVKSSESSTHGVVTTHIFSFLVHFGWLHSCNVGELGDILSMVYASFSSHFPGEDS